MAISPPDPTRTVPAALTDDPAFTAVAADRVEPMLTACVTVIPLARLVSPSVDKQLPTRRKLHSESELARITASLVDTPLPRFANPAADIAPPSNEDRATDTELPSPSEPLTDTNALSWTLGPLTDMLEPSLAMPLIDAQLPVATESVIDIAEPTVEHRSVDRLSPTLSALRTVSELPRCNESNREHELAKSTTPLTLNELPIRANAPMDIELDESARPSMETVPQNARDVGRAEIVDPKRTAARIDMQLPI